MLWAPFLCQTCFKPSDHFRGAMLSWICFTGPWWHSRYSSPIPYRHSIKIKTCLHKQRQGYFRWHWDARVRRKAPLLYHRFHQHPQKPTSCLRLWKAHPFHELRVLDVTYTISLVCVPEQSIPNHEAEFEFASAPKSLFRPAHFRANGLVLSSFCRHIRYVWY